MLPPERPVDGPTGTIEPLRGRESEEMLLHYGAATHVCGRLQSLNASAMVCLARILLALIEGLGPELSRKREVCCDCVGIAGCVKLLLLWGDYGHSIVHTMTVLVSQGVLSCCYCAQCRCCRRKVLGFLS